MPDTAFDYTDFINQYRPKPDEVDMNTQRKIAKGNAIAEAFRLLIDASGGKKGANIQERTAPTNAVMGAVERYYKAKDASKAEQDQWDKMELGAGLDSLKTKASQDFTSQKQKESQDFSREMAGGQQEFAAGQSKLTREQQAEQFAANQQDEQGKLKQQSEQFKQELGLKSRSQTEDTQVKYAQIEASRERYRSMYPYGANKGMFVSDTDVQKQINIPDNKKQQVLAFITADPNVKDEIPVIQMRYGNVGADAKTDYMIADLYPALSPETRAKIRQFIGDSNPAQPAGQKPGDQFLFYKNTPAPQTPTIKTDKKSTMVQVQQPEPAPAQNPQLTPDQASFLQKAVQAKNYSPEQKRDGVYKYLVEQGYDEESAKNAAVAVYLRLTAK